MSAWSAPAVGLSDADVTGGGTTVAPNITEEAGTPVTGAAVNYERVMSVHAIQAAVSDLEGDFVVVALQGSLDGVNWYVLTTPTFVGDGTIMSSPVTTPAQYVQVVATAVTAGSPITTATVNALVIAKETAD
jgi:hypothetical protein